MKPIFRTWISLPSLVLTCILIAPASCSHPGQITLQFGQCVLDDGILDQVFTALSQEDYAQAIIALALKDAPDLLECALHAIASQSPVQGTGSGSEASTATKQIAPIQVTRAREILAKRAYLSKNHEEK